MFEKSHSSQLENYLEERASAVSFSEVQSLRNKRNISVLRHDAMSVYFPGKRVSILHK